MTSHAGNILPRHRAHPTAHEPHRFALGIEGLKRDGSFGRHAEERGAVRFDGDGLALWEQLVQRGVLVRDFSRWPRLRDCLRITIGTKEEDDVLLDALREAIGSVR